MKTAELIGLAAIVFASVTFVVVGDTAGKLLTEGGMAPGFVAWARFAIGALILAPFCGLRRSDLALLQDKLVWLRATLIACGIASILTALRTEPLANVFGALFIGPTVSYVLAILVLGERAEWGRTLALGLGFLGVLMVVKPGFGATAGMGFAVAAGCFYGAYLTITRAIASAYRPRALLMSQLIIGALLLVPFGLPGLPGHLDMPLAALIGLSALGSALGNYFIVLASRRAEAGLIAPLLYTQLISATVIGFVVFGDWPDLWSCAGLILIAASGAAMVRFGGRMGRS